MVWNPPWDITDTYCRKATVTFWREYLWSVLWEQQNICNMFYVASPQHMLSTHAHIWNIQHAQKTLYTAFHFKEMSPLPPTLSLTNSQFVLRFLIIFIAIFQGEMSSRLYPMVALLRVGPMKLIYTTKLGSLISVALF